MPSSCTDKKLQQLKCELLKKMQSGEELPSTGLLRICLWCMQLSLNFKLRIMLPFPLVCVVKKKRFIKILSARDKADRSLPE